MSTVRDDIRSSSNTNTGVTKDIDLLDFFFGINERMTLRLSL